MNLIGNHTKVRADLRTFFLMDMRGLTDEHKRTLGQANNEHVWDGAINVLTIKLDQPYMRRTASSMGLLTRAFHAEQESPEDTAFEDDDSSPVSLTMF